MRFTLPDLATENSLLERARRGDKSALSAMYESYFASVYQFIRFRIRDPREAEDIASDVFLKLLDAFGKRAGPRQSLRGWLFRVARNEVNAHYGKAREMLDTAFDDWEPAPAVSAEDDLESRTIRSLEGERARQAIRMLPADQQEVLLLRFGEGLSLEETAEIMGKRVGAIKSLQFRAVETLRNILGKVSAYG